MRFIGFLRQHVCKIVPGRPGARAALAALVLSLALGPMASQAAPAAGKYRSHAELSGFLKGLVSSHQDIARLESIGKSVQGRDLWLVTIAGPSAVKAGERPALFIGANFEADQLVGSEIAISAITELLKGYPADPETKQRLESAVIYIAPRLNPDGAEAMLAPVQSLSRTNLAPRDDDNDGRADEDGPEDLNKDGFVTLMRVRTPGGAFRIDPDEPLLMKKADPGKGETGGWAIYTEGTDSDGDGFINEDGPGGTDLNRNFQHDYPYYAADAGPHMISEPEARALMDWLLAHRNVAAVLTFGGSDNLIAVPDPNGRPVPSREIDLLRFAEASVAGAGRTGMIESQGMGRFGRMMRMMMARPSGPTTESRESGRFRMPERKPAMAVDAADIGYFKTVGAKYLDLTGIKQPPAVRDPHGAFFQYGYFQFGVPSFTTPGWGIPAAEKSEGPKDRPADAASRPAMTAGAVPGRMPGAPGADVRGQAPGADTGIDASFLTWLDSEKIDGFIPWTKFKHPDLGEVEIGGFKPQAVSNPPVERAAELGPAQTKFALYLASLLPRVRVASTEVESHGGGVFRVKAEVENAGYLPTALTQGVTARAVKPVLVQIEVKPEDILFGNPKTSFIPALAGSGSRSKFEWVIRGKSGEAVEIRVVSEKGGSDRAAVTLR
ncbi:MAG: M14 family metallopeptidase [Candidatus Aminicenantales bacterium]